MAYEDSDYTFMIAIMHCPNRTILVLKLTSVVEIQALCCAIGRHCSIALFDVGCQYSLTEAPQRFWPHGRDRRRSLTLTFWNSPCWLSCECCNNVLSSFWSPLLAIDWAWLPRGMCVNWNELQYLACATASHNRGCNAAMNGTWEHSKMISDLPNIYIAIMVLTWCVMIGTNCHT